MEIHVDPDARSNEVRDVDDLRRFNVVVTREAPDELTSRALAPLARLESHTHAWVSIPALRAACGRDGDASWSERFDAMVDFAASRGWLDETGTSLRAHLVYVPVTG